MIIVLAGRAASGKTTIAELAARRASGVHGSFGGYVRHLATERGLDTGRLTLQDLGQSLVEDDVDGFVQGFLDHYGYRPGTAFIVDGLRHMAVLDSLKQRVSAADDFLRVGFVDVSDDVRTTRLAARGLSCDDIAAIERHLSEQDVLSKLKMAADFMVDGQQPVEEAVSAVLALLR